jgi:ankyrin repeat protein
MSEVSHTFERSSLIIAAQNGDAAEVQLLLHKGIAVNARDARGGTALTHAAHSGHAAVAKLLLSAGADMNACDAFGWTPLRNAAHGGHSAVVRFFLSRGADSNVLDGFAKTPLMYAAAGGHLECIEELLKAGAKVDQKSRTGKTAFMYAAEENHEKAAALLLSTGADPKAKDHMGWTALRYAARKGAEQTVAFLLSLKLNVDAQDVSGKTPLMGACRKGHRAVVEQLLRAKADTNFQTQTGKTALMFAVYEGHREIVELLLKAGADVTRTDEFQWSALSYAVMKNRPEIVKILIEGGADINAQDLFDRSLRQLALQKGHSEIATLILPFSHGEKEKFPLPLGEEKGEGRNASGYLKFSKNSIGPLAQKVNSFDWSGNKGVQISTRSSAQLKAQKSCIAVLTYNRQSVLKPALESLAKHCHAPIAIFEDAGFKDDTRKKLAVGAPKLRPALEVEEYVGPDFTAFLGTSNLGVAGNTNRAIQWFLESDFDHLLLCNDDFIALGDFVSFYAQAHRDLGIGLFCFCDHEELEYQPKVAELNGYTLHLHPRPTGLVISLTREVIETIGFFDVRYGRYGQEHVGFNYRAAKAGFLIVNGEEQKSIDVKPPRPLLKNQNVFTAISLEEIQEAYLLAYIHGFNTPARCKIEGLYQPFRLRKGMSKNKYLVPFDFWDYQDRFQI